MFPSHPVKSFFPLASLAPLNWSNKNPSTPQLSRLNLNLVLPLGRLAERHSRSERLALDNGWLPKTKTKIMEGQQRAKCRQHYHATMPQTLQWRARKVLKSVCYNLQTKQRSHRCDVLPWIGNLTRLAISPLALKDGCLQLFFLFFRCSVTTGVLRGWNPETLWRRHIDILSQFLLLS